MSAVLTEAAAIGKPSTRLKIRVADKDLLGQTSTGDLDDTDDTFAFVPFALLSHWVAF